MTEEEALTPVGGDPAPTPAAETVNDAPAVAAEAALAGAVVGAKKTKNKHSKKSRKPVEEEDAPDRTLQDSDRVELKAKKTTTKRKLLNALRR